MPWLAIVQLAIQFAPLVKRVLDESTSNEEATTKLKALSPDLPKALETIGSALFPKAAPGLKVIAGAIGAFDPNVTKWLQDALNKLVKTSSKLDVDGIYGPETVAAVEALQQKLGLKVDGLAGQLTQAAIIAELGKLH
jgi:peptidoglycan hydrolase-like protein with peptidoglycan-binding domain